MPTALRLLPLLATLVLAATLLPQAPATAEVFPGAQYREEYFPMGDDLATVLHADVLRSQSVSWTERQPVVLVVSPYTNHSGSTTDINPFGGDGPNPRFYDFLELTGALDEGYTFAQVDLPGFGGSSGCNDWGGEREQGAVKAAVEWAARQPWSNGRVALLGKSYDGWTGLMGMAQDPIGLEAVVSMAPVYSGYRYLFNNGVRFLNSVATPALFQAIDAKPGALNDDPQYHVNGAPQAWCYGVNLALQQQDSEDVAFWAVRDLVRHANGSDVPVFLTQGLLEGNTKPDAALMFWNGLDHTAGDHRLWLGQFDHDRGWDRQGGDPLDLDRRPLTGREDFVEQMMRFLEEHLRPDLGTTDDDLPVVEVQDNLGRYRAEAVYPPADVTELVTGLRTGTYTDGGTGTTQIVSTSQPMPHDIWMAGEPVVSVTVETTVPRGNLTVLTYDVDEVTGKATLIHRGTSLIRGTGVQQVDLPLYAQDWVLREGRRLAVVVRADNSFWVHVPTGQDITVTSADIAFPFLTLDRTAFVDEAGSTPRLEGHLQNSQASVATLVAADNLVEFALPGPLG